MLHLICPTQRVWFVFTLFIFFQITGPDKMSRLQAAGKIITCLLAKVHQLKQSVEVEVKEVHDVSTCLGCDACFGYCFENYGFGVFTRGYKIAWYIYLVCMLCVFELDMWNE